MGKKSNNKGITLVYIAIMIVALVALVGLAVDLGYMYVVKGQLQIAADASSLAGVPNLDGTTNVAQTAARQAAWSFACNNKAAQSPVLLGTGTDCTAPGNLDVNGDIVVGFWDGTTFTPGNGTIPINAVQVRASKTVETVARAQEGTPPRFAIFFGKILGWSTMTAGASAIATLGLPVLPIPICLPRCNDQQNLDITDFNDPNCPGKKYLRHRPGDDPKCGIAWARLEPCPPGGGPCQVPTPPYIEDYLANPVGVNLCNKCIRTTQGVAEAALTDLQAAFDKNKAPQKIRYPKDAAIQAQWSSTVTGWKAVIPIIQDTAPIPPQPQCGSIGPQACPGDQPSPYLVVRMAPVIITKVDTPPHDSCVGEAPCNQPRTGITLIGLEPTADANRTTIGCLSCADQNDEINKLLGLNPRLVK